MKLNQNGIGSMILPLVICVVLLIGSLVFGFWALSGRDKYKNDTSSLISTAVATAKQQQQTSDNQTYASDAQNPLVTFTGPQAYGSISLSYPKNWSAYVNSTGSDGFPIDGFFYPGILPSVTDDGTNNYALRIQVNSQTYSGLLQSVDSAQQAGLVTVTPFSLKKLPSVVGVEVTGKLAANVNGTQIILPLRTEVLVVWTEGTQYLSEFNQDILPNLSFSP